MEEVKVISRRTVCNSRNECVELMEHLRLESRDDVDNLIRIGNGGEVSPPCQSTFCPLSYYTEPEKWRMHRWQHQDTLR